MKITLEPTEEVENMLWKGIVVPTRVYRGLTEGGVSVMVNVTGISPTVDSDDEWHKLKKELPSYFIETETYVVNKCERKK